MEKKYYDFIEVVRTTIKDKEMYKAIVTGHVCNGERTKIQQKEVNGKKVLCITLKIQGKFDLKYDVAKKQYDKEKSYNDTSFVRVNIWDERKFNVLKNANNILISGMLLENSYNKDGKEIKYLSINVGEYDSLKVLNFKDNNGQNNNIQKPYDFESEDNTDYSEMPF